MISAIFKIDNILQMSGRFQGQTAGFVFFIFFRIFLYGIYQWIQSECWRWIYCFILCVARVSYVWALYLVICLMSESYLMYFKLAFQLEADPRSQTSVHLSWKLVEGQERVSYYTIKYQQVTLSPTKVEPRMVNR